MSGRSRSERLADFQHGRAPDLAALASGQAAEARGVMLERKRREALERVAALEAEAVAAHERALIAEGVAVLTEAMGSSKRLVCPGCKRTLNSGCRTCNHCGTRAGRIVPLAGRAVVQLFDLDEAS
jgi:hypothetical protein